MHDGGRVLVRVQNLSVEFRTRAGIVHAVDGVSLDIHAGETVALVGESGSGKTTVGRSMLGLNRPSSGTIDVSALATHRGIQLVYQDPMASLDPRWSVARSVAEPLKSAGTDRQERRERAEAALAEVSLDPSFLDKHPHQLSGGQRQRVCIARALVARPEVIVCDESVSALDVSVQAQVLNLLKKIQRERGVAYLFITHDLSVVRYIADTVVVLYLGRVVERASRQTLFANPKHPYSIALLGTAPSIEDAEAPRRIRLRGEVPSAINPPSGCAFASRCPLATELCRSASPELRSFPDGAAVACHRAEEVAAMADPREMFQAAAPATA